jgi:hypothetical protein
VSIRLDACNGRLPFPPVDLLEQSGNFAYVVCIILGQSVRNGFTGVRVDREMELAPRSAMAAVSLLVPVPRKRLVGACCSLIGRAGPPGATGFVPVLETPRVDMCPGGLVSTDAQ